MKYKSGYKYVLAEKEKIKTNIIGYSFKTKFFSLTLVGVMTGYEGYAWNGANCFPDVKSIMRGSLGHDIGYQMIEERLLPLSEKPLIDQLIYDCCIEDGMPEFMAKGVLEAVEAFGVPDKEPEKKILTAP